MNGKIIAAALVVPALMVGAAVYYLQVYGYYRDVAPNGSDDVTLVNAETGEAEVIPYADFRAIDADSSPIRYRACFTTTLGEAALAETYQDYPEAEPLIAPGWFGCFDAEEIGGALEDGGAMAFLSKPEVHYGIDRVVAILPDGRGFAWNQINRCGTVVFDGNPAPEGCPEPPDGVARQ